MAGPVKVAVLDDYIDFAEPFFKHLDSSEYETTIFKDTLLPYNHPNTAQNEKDRLVKRLEPFHVICTMRERTPFPAALIARLPNLKLLLTTGRRNAALDLPAFQTRSVPVGAAPGPPHDPSSSQAGLDSTSEHTVALILAAARNLAQDDASLHHGGWQTGAAVSLSGKVLGVMGLGRIGSLVAKTMVAAFGMRVLAWSPNLTQEAADAAALRVGLPVEYHDSAGAAQKTFRAVGKEELFREADVLSVHVVLSDRSRGIIAASDLAQLKPSAIFVNTSRGPLVVEDDLLDVLRRGAIRAAALDVFNLEPLPLESPWRTEGWGEGGRSRVTLSPHMGYVDESTLTAWYKQQVEDIKRWRKGEKPVVRLV